MKLDNLSVIETTTTSRTVDVSKMSKRQLTMLKNAIEKHMGVKGEVKEGGKRGRPKGSTNGTKKAGVKKGNKKKGKKHHPGQNYNRATNILHTRPRPVSR